MLCTYKKMNFDGMMKFIIVYHLDLLHYQFKEQIYFNIFFR